MDSKRDVGPLWDKFTRDRSTANRNALIERYLPLARYHAERVHVKLPDEVQVDDLISAGVFGLMDAINGFQPERRIMFETYAAPRIRGAILDELREMDWVPRLVRSRSQKLNGATTQLELELGRAPTKEELAKRLKVPMAEFEKIARDGAAVSLVSLSRKWFETDSNKDVREVDTVSDKRSIDPVREAERNDLKAALGRGFSRAERLIILHYYFDGMNMREVGAALDLSELRVSQLHSSVIARLRARMTRRQEAELAAA